MRTADASFAVRSRRLRWKTRLPDDPAQATGAVTPIRRQEASACGSGSLA
jgi:hypothetical protein